MQDRADSSGLDVTEEVVLEKYEGEPKEGDKPVEVIKIRNGEVVEHKVYPPPMDSSMAVNTQVLGVDNASN